MGEDGGPPSRIVDRKRVRLKTVCVNQDGEEVMVGEALLSPPKVPVAYTERKTGPAAVAHWSLQPWLWSGQVASTFARTSTSMMAVWHTESEERPENGHPKA